MTEFSTPKFVHDQVPRCSKAPESAQNAGHAAIGRWDDQAFSDQITKVSL
jgi:hypothetical protein